MALAFGCGRSPEAEVYEVAKAGVLLELRAPATAVFPPLPYDPNPRTFEQGDRVLVIPPPNESRMDRARAMDAADAGRLEDWKRILSEGEATPEAQHRWRVDGYVDAQNAYGALIRTRYSLRVIEDSNAHSDERFRVEFASVDLDDSR